MIPISQEKNISSRRDVKRKTSVISFTRKIKFDRPFCTIDQLTIAPHKAKAIKATSFSWKKTQRKKK